MPPANCTHERSPCRTSENNQLERFGTLARRDLLRGMLVTAAAAVVPNGWTRAQTAAVSAGRIDFHHHFASPRWLAKAAGNQEPGLAAIPGLDAGQVPRGDGQSWGIDRADLLHRARPAISWHGLDATRSMARDLNEYGAKMVADYKGRFGLLATLYPLDVDNSLKEIEYALGTLNAVGFGLITSYGDKWMGDPGVPAGIR